MGFNGVAEAREQSKCYYSNQAGPENERGVAGAADDLASASERLIQEGKDSPPNDVPAG